MIEKIVESGLGRFANHPSCISSMSTPSIRIRYLLIQTFVIDMKAFILVPLGDNILSQLSQKNVTKMFVKGRE